MSDSHVARVSSPALSTLGTVVATVKRCSINRGLFRRKSRGQEIADLDYRLIALWPSDIGMEFIHKKICCNGYAEAFIDYRDARSSVLP